MIIMLNKSINESTVEKDKSINEYCLLSELEAQKLIYESQLALAELDYSTLLEAEAENTDNNSGEKRASIIFTLAKELLSRIDGLKDKIIKFLSNLKVNKNNDSAAKKINDAIDAVNKVSDSGTNKIHKTIAKVNKNISSEEGKEITGSLHRITNEVHDLIIKVGNSVKGLTTSEEKIDDKKEKLAEESK